MRNLGRATALGVAARRRKAGNLPLLRTLQDLGVATSLEVCLDAADYASYTGSGQSWLDTSGNGYDFFRGADGNASTDDPTFVGTAGDLRDTTYWSFDGGDFFTYDTTNTSFMNTLHQNNAVGTFAMWFYLGATGSNVGLCGTGTGTSTNAFAFFIDTSSQLHIQVFNGSGTASNKVQSGVPASQWAFLGVSFDEAGGTVSRFFINDTIGSAQDFAYASPSAVDATHTFGIAQRGNGNAGPPNGSRMAQFMAWSRMLGDAELSDIYTKTRTRFGV